MVDDEDRDSQLELLKSHRRTLSILLRQQARHGGEMHAPPGLVNNIYDARADIRHIKEYLRENGVEVEDHVDDNPYTSEAGPARFDLRIEVDHGFVPFILPATRELDRLLDVVIVSVKNVGTAPSYVGKVLFRAIVDGTIDDFQIFHPGGDREMELMNPKPDTPVQPGSEQRYVFRFGDVSQLRTRGTNVLPVEVIVHDQIGHIYRGEIHENIARRIISYQEKQEPVKPKKPRSSS